jgi:hypothetical protein
MPAHAGLSKIKFYVSDPIAADIVSRSPSPAPAACRDLPDSVVEDTYQRPYIPIDHTVSPYAPQQGGLVSIAQPLSPVVVMPADTTRDERSSEATNRLPNSNYLLDKAKERQSRLSKSKAISHTGNAFDLDEADELVSVKKTRGGATKGTAKRRCCKSVRGR